jgi:hypothetical protein
MVPASDGPSADGRFVPKLRMDGDVVLGCFGGILKTFFVTVASKCPRRNLSKLRCALPRCVEMGLGWVNFM